MECIEKAIDVSAHKLGYASVKSHQLAVISSYVRGEDVLAVLPTGYGKSLCYALLPLLFGMLSDSPTRPSIVIVLTPLIAIMKDQASQHKYMQ